MMVATLLLGSAHLPGVAADADRVTGIVVDDTGAPLVGATVGPVGGTLSTRTGEDGRFEIYVKPKERLVVSLGDRHVTYSPSMSGTNRVILPPALPVLSPKSIDVEVMGLESRTARAPSLPHGDYPQLVTGENPSPLITLIINNDSILWLLDVPYPASFGGFAPDAIVTVQSFDYGSACLRVSSLSSSRSSFQVGVRVDSVSVSTSGTVLPDSLVLCGTAGVNSIHVQFSANPALGSLGISAQRSMTTYGYLFDEMPSAMEIVATQTDSEGVDLDFAMSRSTNLTFHVLGGAVLSGVISPLPASFHGHFDRRRLSYSDGIEETSVDVQFVALTGIDRLAIDYGRAADAEYAHVDLRSIPAAYRGSSSWRTTDGAVYWVDHQHEATQVLGPLTVWAKSGGTPLFIGIDELPARVDLARFRDLSSGAVRSYAIDMVASDPMSAVWIELGSARSPLHVLTFIAEVPAGFEASFQSLAALGGLDHFRYSHDATASIHRLDILVETGGALSLQASLLDLAAYLAVEFAVRPYLGGTFAPSLEYEASAPGSRFDLAVTGNDLLGGTIEATIRDLPIRAVAGLRPTGSWERAVLEVDTQGSGSIGVLGIYGHLPGLAATASFSDFRIYLEGVRHFTLVDHEVLYHKCVLRALDCQNVVNHDLDYGYWHRSAVCFNLWSLRAGIDRMTYVVSQETPTGSVERYRITEENSVIYDPSLLTPGQDIWALGT